MVIENPDSQEVVFLSHKDSADYREKAFFLWYKLGKPPFTKLHEAIPTDTEGRKPNTNTLRSWKHVHHWEERATILDIEVVRQVESKTIEEKVQMLRLHAETGRELQSMGLDFLRENGFTRASDALKAVIQGVTIERMSRGLPDALVKISEMSNEDLQSVVNNLLAKAKPHEVDQIVSSTVKELKSSSEEELTEGEWEDSDAD